MSTRIENTRLALRVAGLLLLWWCWRRIDSDVAMWTNQVLVGNWTFFGNMWRTPFRLLNDGRVNWSKFAWYLWVGVGVYLVFWNAGIARLLWRGLLTPQQCASCGYDRRGLDAAASCPECGSRA
jgi:hypothetical protein